MDRSFWRAGHTPTLLSAFLYFDLSFMVWYLLGPLQIQLAQALSLNTQQRGLMVATPILAGAILRLFMGMLADRIGAKRAGLIGQLIVIAALLAAWQLGIHNLQHALLLGVFLGVAGASFAVALPLASRWYPPQHQGTAMGIAGAGNSGTVLAALFAPALAVGFGWQNVFGLVCVPLVLVLAFYWRNAKDAPGEARRKTLADYGRMLGNADAWWFMFFYALTFGGFSGFASALPGYFHDQFNFDPKLAGWATAACVFAGSVMRPLGGVLADRIGGTRSLLGVYATVAALIALAALNPAGAAVQLALFIGAMLCLGAGNGAVFQLVPQRFGKEIGVMTGLIGMAGGIGGFALAASLAAIKQHSGDYAGGLWLFAALAVAGWASLANVKQKWRNGWAVASARV
ncbi:MFS transporter, NNP family, nitrate/nitrite transporter [Andreprevotia lacus DSM 23236]|jgi:NNP family nitrate/nitrite transporter-like MFS transporter|uniref:MFS transporter, NNP family, nitrate/nitrite transporter n=1 Tax=Andreprevotia lacus DSM 23236 TaxID=1121001 RepID=A0A1W1XHI5_9NEIS|nr:nitrate/nitrite transporter [Andreprevotia lacus]SMC22958.1 MFS transporter, NNP family, nitrate/nitrite transporter [Andreprevotia lacus DSM 23236]